MRSLEEQITLGIRASSAYTAYLKDVIEQELTKLSGAILDTENVEELINLSRQVKAWKTVEQRINEDINSGRMAEISLSEGKK